MRIFEKCLYVYACLISLWFLANRLFQDSWWGFVVSDKFAEYFVMPAVLVFLLSLLARRVSISLVAAVPLAICAFFYLPFFLTVSSPVVTAGDQLLRVATYNIWNHNRAFDEIAEVLEKSGADVIALQEVTEEQKPDLVNAISPAYPYFHVGEPVYGGTTALFSRLPLRNVEEIDVDIDRPSIIADIVFNEQKITVVSAHLNPSFWAYWQQPWHRIPGNYHQYIKDQNTQATAIMEAVQKRNQSIAAYIACDCNSQETASTNRLLRQHFHDTFRTLGWQLGEPGSPHMKFERKLTHIDYIWFKGKTRPNAIYRSTYSAGSDHDLLLAEFEIDDIAKP